MTEVAETNLALDWGVMRPRLVQFLTRQRGCSATAEDVVQDLWLKMGRLPPDRSGSIANPGSYLFTAAANLARDHVRAHRRRADCNAEALAHVFDGLEDASTLSPERLVGADQELRRAIDAIDSLPARSRQIFATNRFDGVSYRQIAKQLAISTTAVEKHMKRALSALANLDRDEGICR